MVFDSYIRDNKDAVIAKIVRIAGLIGCPKPDWFNILFYLESGVNPKAVNWQKGDPGSANPSKDTDAARRQRCVKRATGIFQCMPSTARAIGTTTQALYDMNTLQQLDYYYKYLQLLGAKNRIKSFYDLYIINFYPVALGKADNFVMVGAAVAAQNSSLDLNHNGAITVGEFKQSIDNRLKSVKTAYDFVIETVKKKV